MDRQVDKLEVVGLAQERKQVFASGLAILIGLFRSLQIQGMTLSGGALREGILYGMLPQLQHTDVRNRTIASLMVRYTSTSNKPTVSAIWRWNWPNS